MHCIPNPIGRQSDIRLEIDFDDARPPPPPPAEEQPAGEEKPPPFAPNKWETLSIRGHVVPDDATPYTVSLGFDPTNSEAVGARENWEKI
jgi:hypothetical protein